MKIVTRIKVNSGSRSIVKLGFLIKATFLLFMAIGCFTMGIPALRQSYLAASIWLLAGLVLFYIFFKMLDGAFFSEWLLVGPDEVKYHRKTITGYDEKTFAFSEIKSLGFAGYQEYTPHPMDSPVIDFTGLGVGEKEMQYVIDEGTIEFVTAEGSFRFGKNLPSWEAEEVLSQLQSLSGNKLNRVDKVKDEETPVDGEPINDEEAGGDLSST